jgi:hypothetical protein
MLLRRLVAWLFGGEEEQRDESSATSASNGRISVAEAARTVAESATELQAATQAADDAVADAASVVEGTRGLLHAAGSFDTDRVDVLDFVSHLDEESTRGPMKRRRSDPTRDRHRSLKGQQNQVSPKSRARKDRRMQRRRQARSQHARNC